MWPHQGRQELAWMFPAIDPGGSVARVLMAHGWKPRVRGGAAINL